MKKNQLDMHMIKPSPISKRKRVASISSRRVIPALLPSEMDGKKKLLREDRISSVQEISIRKRDLLDLLLGFPLITFYEAREAWEGVSIINEIIKGKEKRVYTNNSLTVQELSLGLKEKQIEVVKSYQSDLVIGRSLFQGMDYFDPSTIRENFGEDSFQEKIFPLGSYYPLSQGGFTALLGVNTISLEDGSIYFLEHTSNISYLLDHGETLILLVSLEKIAASNEKALLQTKLAGYFGLKSVLRACNEKIASRFLREESLPVREKRERGKREVHIILLDNGRSDLVGTKYEEILYCINCRSCSFTCPGEKAFPEEETYPGRRILSYLQKKGKEPSREDIRPLEFCLQCGTCHLECPIGINLPAAIINIRAQYRKSNFHFRDLFLENPSLPSQFGSPVTDIAKWSLKQPFVRFFLEKAINISKDAPLPEITRGFSPKRSKIWREGDSPLEISHNQYGLERRKVAFFVGCFTPAPVGEGVLRLLRQNHIQVIIPPQKCCGIPKLGAGKVDQVRGLAEYNLQSFLPYIKENYPVITVEPSCGLCLRYIYPNLFPGEEMSLLGASIYDFCEYLLRLREMDLLYEKYSLLSERVAYHASCHLRAQGVKDTILGSIPDLSITSLDRGCCGMGGTFGMKQEYSKKAQSIGRALIHRIDELDVDLVLTECSACKAQIGEGTGKKTIHPVLFLEKALL